MIQQIQDLIESLREELQQYGEMLALLDRQQDLVVARAAGDVFQLVRVLQNQSAVIQQARSRREGSRRSLARSLAQTDASTFATLLPLLPADYRPLVKALVDENNALLARIQQRTRQNHLLLSRSVEFMQDLINSLLPGREMRVYDGHGKKDAHPLAKASFYEAVG
jgi:flagellar biosynthesis/type III secretory pathway chaperone